MSLRFVLASALLLPVALPAEPTPSGEGLAARYPGDHGLAADPAVRLFTDFETEQWRKQWDGGRRDTVRVIQRDPGRRFAPLAGRALRLVVPGGEHYGGSLEHHFDKDEAGEPQEIFFRYYLRLGDDWNPSRGGKLPGLAGTYGKAGWGGRPSNGHNGWSARGLFEGREDGATPIGFYAYHADMKGKYGAHWRWDREGRGRLQNNRWYCIEQFARMNTPGKADGILRAWIDGHLAFENTSVRMRDNDMLKIQFLWINLYHGGSWAATDDDSLFLDNVVAAEKYIGPRREAEPNGQ